MSWRLLGAFFLITIAFVLSTTAQAQDSQETELMSAVREGNLKQVKKLAQKSAVQIQNSQGDTALLLAVSLEGLENQAQIVEVLAQAGSRLDLVGSLGQTAPEIAVEKNQSDLLLALGKKTKSWVQKKSKDGSTLLIQAAKLGNTESVKTLLRLGARKQDQDKQGKTARDHALQMKFKETAKLL